MPQTFAEKALARAAGLVTARAGDVLDVAPDVVFSHDNSAAILRIFNDIAAPGLAFPERIAMTLDHAVPAPTTLHAQNHAEIRAFAAQYGLRLFEVGRGICHQVLSEEGVVLPGETVFGADSHTTHFGWLGAFGMGVGRTEVAALWATGRLWIRVPETLRVELTGRIPHGVTAKDIALAILRQWTVEGAAYRAIEFDGEAISDIPLDDRPVIPNMMAEFGAKNAWVAPDEKTVAYLGKALKKRLGDYAIERVGDYGIGQIAQSHNLSISQSLLPDTDALYAAEYRYAAADLETYVACPHSVDNVVPLGQIAGTRIQQAFLGTCTNGRIEDLAAAAAIIRGKKVAPGVRFLVIPASSQVLREALALGYIQDFVEAGAVIGVPGCGPCMGNHMGIPAPGEVTISSANRNFRGRMGTADAEIYLANPAVVAASAVAGVIAGPREIGE